MGAWNPKTHGGLSIPLNAMFSITQEGEARVEVTLVGDHHMAFRIVDIDKVEEFIRYVDRQPQYIGQDDRG